MPDASRQVILVLAGGQALGAYQAGAYQALHEHGIRPDWIAGASIGALNAALIIGNAPEARIDRLRQFWTMVEEFSKADPSRSLRSLGSQFAKRIGALETLMVGRPGMFTPRLPGPFTAFLPGLSSDVSLYDTNPLEGSMRRLVDFDRLNDGGTRLTITAVDVETGEDVRFDSTRDRIGPDHLRASGAFLVAYPPIELDGRALVDPGLSANLPLRAVLPRPPERDTLCIAVDLMSPNGPRPKSLGDSIHRLQDLIFSNQSRHMIESLQETHRLRHANRALASKQSAAAGKASATAGPGGAAVESGAVTLLHLVYTNPERETAAKAFDFSSDSIRERWSAGYRDMNAGLNYLESGALVADGSGFTAYRYGGDVLSRYD